MTILSSTCPKTTIDNSIAWDAGERISDKPFGGHTFGDGSNFAGGIGSLLQGIECATRSSIVVAGTLTSGIKFLYTATKAEVHDGMDPCLIFIVLGAGPGVLHGLIKLIVVCKDSCSRVAEQQDPDIENQLDF